MQDKSRIRDLVEVAFVGKTEIIFSRKQIKDLVLKANPGTNPESIIPTDYCYNRINLDPNSWCLRIFEYIKRGQFKCLGVRFPYNGELIRNPDGKGEQIIGKWVNGVPPELPEELRKKRNGY